MRRLGLFGTFVALGGVCLLAAAGPAGATGVPSSSFAELTVGAAFGGSASLNGVSCPSAGSCTAVGSDGNSQPLVVAQSANQWGNPTEVPMHADLGSLNAVSCTSVGNCTAVGSDGNGQAMALTESAGVWAAPSVLPHDGTIGTNVNLTGISCVAAGECTAVGYTGDVQVAVVQQSAGTWGLVTTMSLGAEVGFGGELQAVSCSAPGQCTAAGVDANYQPMIATEGDGDWTASEVTLGSAFGNGGQFFGISCATADGCVAVGGTNNNEPLADVQSSGSWGLPVALTAPIGGGLLTSVSCATAGRCTAAGLGGYYQPGEAVLAGGSWSKFVVTPLGPTFGSPSAIGANRLAGVSCTPISNCTTVGGDANYQPIVQQTPVGDLSSSLTGPSTTTIGSSVSYTGTVTNLGSTSAALSYTFSPSTPLKLVSFTAPANASCAPAGAGALRCVVDLAAGSAATIRYRVAAPTGGPFSITATAAQGHYDPSPGNDSAIASTTATTATGVFYTTLSDDGFALPAIHLKGPGKAVFWDNTGPSANDIIDDTGLDLFGSSIGAPVDFAARTFWASGTFTLSNTQSGDSQVVTVPLLRSPSAGTTTTAFVLNWGSSPAPAGYTFQVQIRRPGTTLWENWQTGVDENGSYTPDRGTGTYRFRARLVRSGTLSQSGWSPAALITVN